MKKNYALIFSLALLTLSFCSTIAQPAHQVQAAVVKTADNLRVVVYGKSSAALNNEKFDNIIITLSVPDQTPAANPTFTITQNFITGLGWSALAPFIQGGRVYYVFDGTDAAEITSTWTANSNNPIIELSISNTALIDQIQINDLNPGKGANGKAEWYIQVRNPALGDFGDVTAINAMFYGVGASNSTGRSGPSLAPVQAFSFLPAFLADFNVVKQGNYDAALNWTTSQEQNVSHFVLERSANGNNSWTKFAEVKAKGNSNTSTRYSYTDAKVYDGSSAAKVVFYRIRSVDLDGQEKIFPVRSIRFSATGSKDISLYPNPAKEGFTLSIPLINPVGSKIRLNLINRLGQVVHAREINGVSASNYYYDIKTPGVISGEYMLQILLDNELLDTKKVIVQR